jgi:hypothetical protein
MEVWARRINHQYTSNVILMEHLRPDFEDMRDDVPPADMVHEA